ncbi:MAG: hypothetical protein AB7J35_18315 [Dehalococcoidia bacterium]
MSDFGSFSSLVATAGTIVSAGAAITLAWRGRTDWEPSEQDISTGAQKVGALAAAVLMVVLWASRKELGSSRLGLVAVALVLICIVSLVAYGFLIASYTFEEEITDDGVTTRKRKVIGGFRLTPHAKERITHGMTVQSFFEGTAFQPDEVWTRPSRALAKQSFVAAYILLLSTGTMALTSAALLVDSG